MKFILIIFLFTTNTLASTKFFWVPNERNPRTGTCYEVDTDSNGQRYQVKTKALNCRPKQTAFMFYSDKGRCYEIDNKTNGQEYSKKTNINDCKTKSTKTTFFNINGKSGCFEIDIPSSGMSYYRKLPNKKCSSTEQAIFFWEPKSEFSGSCYREEDSPAGKIKVKVKRHECRPEDPIYKMHKSSDFFKGTCYEIHKESPKKYINKTKPQACRPENTVYIFYKKENAKTGYCYEIDSQTKGENYINRVKNSFCKEQL